MMCMMYVSVTLRNVTVMSRRNVVSMMWIRRASNTLRPTSASSLLVGIDSLFIHIYTNLDPGVPHAMCNHNWLIAVQYNEDNV